ncbi:MAG: type II toxin-antitoxin system HicB family antitoxin [Oscillospiraceae bacterium]
MNKLFYPAIFNVEQDGYSVDFPDFPECITEGDSLEEAYSMAFDVLGLCIEDYKENKKKLPEATAPYEIVTNKKSFIAIIEFDMIAYERKHSNKAVKKTLTIPAWLNSIAEEQHINFSSVLQQALKEQLNV